MIRRLVLKSLVAVTVIILSGSVGAMQSSRAAVPEDETDDMPDVLSSPERPLTAGWVVAIDRHARTIEIRHRPIAALHMEYMTMVFHVADPDLLLGRTVGDKIRFKVERDGSNYVATRIENSN